MSKNIKIYKTIGEVAKILDLTNKKTGKLSTYTIRFWEKEFKQVKPYIFSGKRRYYDNNTIKILKKIQFLLKNKGMTIKGVKKYLNDPNSELDVNNNKTIRTKIIKEKIKKLSDKLKKIKING